MFVLLQEKIREKFVVLRKPNISINITYKDKNGEEIGCDDSDDLDIALEEIGGDDLNLWIIYEDEDEKGKKYKNNNQNQSYFLYKSNDICPKYVPYDSLFANNILFFNSIIT